MNGLKARGGSGEARAGAVKRGVSKRDSTLSHVNISEEHSSDEEDVDENEEVDQEAPQDSDSDFRDDGDEVEDSDPDLELKSKNGDDDEDDDGPDMEKSNEPVSGWADSMAKILGSTKPKNIKNLILSRAKKDYEIVKKENPIPSGKGQIEVVPGGASSVKKLKLDKSEASTSLKVLHQIELELKRKEKEWENINRVKPDPVAEKAVEKELVKIATKGVVQLFNAVSLQQKTLKSKLREARRSEFKKDKILHKTKEIFDSSMEKSKSLGKKPKYNSSSEDDEIEIKDESDDEVEAVSSTKKNTKVTKKRPTWEALHDDYMLDAKVKDWESDGSEEVTT